MASSHKTRTAVLVLDYPPDNRDAIRYGFSTFERAGFSIVVLDTSLVTRQALPPNIPNLYSSSNLIRPKTRKDLRTVLRALDESDVVICLNYPFFPRSVSQLMVLRMLLASRARVGFVIRSQSIPTVRAMNPAYPGNSRTVAKVLARFLLAVCLGGYVKGKGFWRRVDYIWAAVEIPLMARHLIGPGTMTKVIHHLDYDLVVRHQPSVESKKTRGYTLWVDSMGPFHPDIQTQRLPEGSPEQWLRVHRRSLGRIECQLARPVVVAAHPRATPESLLALYENKQIVHGQIFELIHDADVVVANGSTAVGLAAFRRKPIILIDSEFELPFARTIIHAQSHLLNLPLFDIDSETTDFYVPEVDAERYDNYVETYLKAPGTSNAEFFTQVIESLT